MALAPDLLKGCGQTCDCEIGFLHVVIHVNEFGVLVKRGEKKNDQTIGKDFVVDDTSCKIFRQIE